MKIFVFTMFILSNIAVVINGMRLVSQVNPKANDQYAGQFLCSVGFAIWTGILLFG